MRAVSLPLAKSTATKPWKSESCTKMRSVEPSALVVNAMGLMPADSGMVRASVS